MFSEHQVTALMTYMIMLIMISLIAALLFLFLPKPAKHYEVICLRYFCGYFIVSCLSYVTFILSGSGLLPLTLSTFLNNGLAIAAPYFLYMGLSWYHQAAKHLHQSPFILAHITIAATVITLVGLLNPNNPILIELVFFPNLFIAFLLTYRLALKQARGQLTPGGKLFKHTFHFVFLSMVIMLSVIIITEDFFIYLGGIMIMQGLMTIGFLTAIYFSYLYRVIEKLRKTSMTDPLTRLYNRRYFLAQANTIIRSAGRDKQPMSLIMCDIDHFKTINDNFGHEAGDKALIAFANTLSSTLRDQDTIARIGGEEFVILLPNTELDLVKQISQRLKTNTQAIKVDFQDISIRLTASFGICQVDTNQPIEDSMRLADKALYCAKDLGRNRIEHYCSELNTQTQINPQANS